MSSPVRAVVAGHGDYAMGMISAVEQITGRSDVFVGFSNRSLSGSGVELELAALIERTGVQVVFTDLHAGSCAMAARRLQRVRPDLVLGFGANLGTLLDFAIRDDLQAAQAAREAIARGMASMQCVGTGATHGT